MQALVTDLGFDVLFKGTNFTRLLGGMWVTLKISLISVALSIVLGILLGVVMTFKNPVTKAICRVYLEIVSADRAKIRARIRRGDRVHLLGYR